MSGPSGAQTSTSQLQQTLLLCWANTWSWPYIWVSRPVLPSFGHQKYAVHVYIWDTCLTCVCVCSEWGKTKTEWKEKKCRKKREGKADTDVYVPTKTGFFPRQALRLVVNIWIKCASLRPSQVRTEGIATAAERGGKKGPRLGLSRVFRGWV